MPIINADDHPSVQAAINAAAAAGIVEVHFSAKVYDINAELQIPTSGPPNQSIRLRGVPHNYTGLGGTIIRAAQPMRSVLAAIGAYCEMDSIKFDAARKATYGLLLQGATLMRCRNVMVTSALFDGVHLDALKINDSMKWESCIIEQNGTNYVSNSIAGQYSHGVRTNVAGTANLTANSPNVTFNGAPDLTSLGIRKGDYLRVGATLKESFYGQIESANPNKITLQGNATNLPTVSAQNQPFAIGVGDGWHESRHQDNNVNILDGCLIRLNGGSGIRMNGLFGDTVIGGQTDFNNFGGIVFGPADNQGAVINALVANCYSEENTFTFGFGQATNVTILSPTSGGDALFRVGELTKGTILRDDRFELIELGAQQNFVLQVRNDNGTLKHRIVADIAQGWASVQAVKVHDASPQYQPTPTVTAANGFKNGAGIVTNLTHMLALDTDSTQNVAVSGTVTIEDDSTGTLHRAMLSTDARNIKGVTINRPVLYLRDSAGTFLPWSTQTIPNGRHIAIRVSAYIR